MEEPETKEKKTKVVILDEKEYDKQIKAPPNYFSWFVRQRIWDELPTKGPYQDR